MTTIEREDWEKGRIIKTKNDSSFTAELRIKTESGVNQTILFEEFNHIFPKAEISIVGRYFIFKQKTIKIEDLIADIQAIHGVESALCV